MPPSVSVVTVTRNAANVLPRLIASLRAQADTCFDFILIDGASNDETWQLAQEARDIITYAKSEPDSGVYDALNKAITQVRTDFYLVMGADDILYRDAISNFKSAAQSTDADIIVADVKIGSRTRRGYHAKRAWLGHSAMITSHSVGMLIRTNLHDRFGKYPLCYPILADGYIVKTLCTNASVKTVSGGFLAGEFCDQGMSNRSFIRVLCETWQIQIDTGENRLVQYLLFQFRVLKYLHRILRR
jgi:glycosyltransferase involved in cell wall biosynthesis